MNKTQLKKLIGERIVKEEAFIGFNWINSESSIIRKTNYGFDKIEFQISQGYDLDNDLSCLEVLVYYSKRFDILHDWFDKFNFKSKNDIKYSTSILDEGEDMGLESVYYFADDGSTVEKDYKNMLNSVHRGSDIFFNKFKDLKDVYNQLALPMLEDNYVFNLVGADWFFRALMLVHLCNPSASPEFKIKMKAHAKFVFDRGEPNMERYYPRIDEIIEEIEKTKIENS